MTDDPQFDARSHLRALTRLAVFAVVTLAHYAVLVSSVLWTRGSPARGLEARNAVFSSWARALVRLLGIQLRVDGPPPERPSFVVCNHLGYVDVIVLAATTRAVFVAKSEVSRWPLFGLLSRSVNTVFIDRERIRDIPRVVRTIAAVLEAGQSVVVFPEGTSTAGDRVLPFRASLLEVAASRRLEVAHASVRYRTWPPSPAAAESVCWWGDMTLAGHLYGLFALPGFEARVRFGTERIVETDRKVLARRLHRAVATDLGLGPSEPSEPRVPIAVGDGGN